MQLICIIQFGTREKRVKQNLISQERIPARGAGSDLGMWEPGQPLLYRAFCTKMLHYEISKNRSKKIVT